MTIFRVSLCCICFIIYVSCKNQTSSVNDGHVVKKEFNDKKVLIREQQYLKRDTGLVEDGYYKAYYDDGSLALEGYMKDGNHYGIEKYYYKSGSLRQKMNYFHNMPIGPQYAYYENGEPMVFFFQKDNGTLFKINYSPERKIDSVKGHPMFVGDFNNDEQYIYNKSDTAFLMWSLIYPPDSMNFVISMNIQQIRKSYIDTISISKLKKIDFLSMFTFEYPFICQYGSGTCQFIYTLFDKYTNECILSDTVIWSVKVK